MSKPQFGEPWTTRNGEIYDRHGVILLGSELERAVLAANACAGLSDEQLKRVRAVNEIYESCREILKLSRIHKSATQLRAMNMAEKAIALAEGKEGE